MTQICRMPVYIYYTGSSSDPRRQLLLNLFFITPRVLVLYRTPTIIIIITIITVVLIIITYI